MNKGILRSIGIFTAIALTLVAIVIGGVRLVKNRSDQYATKNIAPTTVPNTQQGQQTPTSPQNQPQQSPSSPQKKPEQTTTPSSTPTPLQQPHTIAKGPSEVPVTGPTEDMMLTILFMMCAAYFGLVLKRARASYRQLLN